MRIAYVLTTLGIGGAEKQAIQIAESMRARGHVVVLLILLPPCEQEWETKLPVMRLNLAKNPLSLFRILGFAHNFLSMYGPDILHSHTSPANLFARLLRATGSSACVINTIHNVREGGWFRRALYRLSNRWVDRSTAVSVAVLERCVACRLLPRSKIEVLANGIDLAEFEPDSIRRARVRQQFGVEGNFIWLAVGRIDEAKDYPNLLRAFALVRERFPQSRLWIAGEQRDATHAHRSQKLKRLFDNAQNVSLLGLRRDVAALLDACDGFVLSSAWEGLPLVIAEAMAMRKPIVATNVGGVKELIGEGELPVSPQDSCALAERMMQVMNEQRSSIEKRIEAGRRRIEEHFSISVKVNDWERLYREATAIVQTERV